MPDTHPSWPVEAFPPYARGGGPRQGLTSPLQALPCSGSPANIPSQDTSPRQLPVLLREQEKAAVTSPSLLGRTGAGAHELGASQSLA